jgi:hypothetical protein
MEIKDDEGCRAGDLIGLHGVRVRKDRCTTCVFHPGNRMQLVEGRLADLVESNRGGWLTCHQTLPQASGRWHTAAVCHGWEQAYGLGLVLSELVAVFGREDVSDG